MSPTGNDSKGGGNKRKKRPPAADDEAGDGAGKPNDEEQAKEGTTGADGEPEESEDAKLLARREANRMHALKSRQRSKMLLGELQGTVTQLQAEKVELERQNAVLRAQVDVLQQQNRALLQSQQQLLLFPPGGGAAAAGSSGAPSGTTGFPAGFNPSMMPGMFGAAAAGMAAGGPTPPPPQQQQQPTMLPQQGFVLPNLAQPPQPSAPPSSNAAVHDSSSATGSDAAAMPGAGAPIPAGLNLSEILSNPAMASMLFAAQQFQQQPQNGTGGNQDSVNPSAFGAAQPPPPPPPPLQQQQQLLMAALQGNGGGFPSNLASLLQQSVGGGASSGDASNAQGDEASGEPKSHATV